MDYVVDCIGELCRSIKAIAYPEPVLICIDHEGGALNHLSDDFEALLTVLREDMQ